MGEFWVGTNFGGLNRFDRNNGIFKSYYFYSSICCISTAYEDKNGRFWITDYFNGLRLFERKAGNFIHYTKNEGLADNTAGGMAEDSKGNLWIGTANGLSKFNPDSKIFKNYKKSDGLLTTNFYWGAVLKDKNGFLYFGGDDGFVKFHPDSLQDNPYPPSVVLTDFKLFNKSVKPSESSSLKKNIIVADEISLSYTENIFSFEFAALDYTNPKKNQYAYMLDGVDNEWRYSGNVRIASYTNIDPGEYVFHVKGSNNDGVWNEEGKSIKIIITPPWWQTWWFRSCGAIVIVGVVGFSFNRRLKTVKKEKKSQEEFTRQLISAQEEERKRIAGELHDSLGQNLLVIKNKAMLGLKKKDNKLLFNEISDLSSSTLQEVREISYNLHPYQLERLGLTKAIESITERALKSTNIIFKDEIDIIDKIFSPEAEINIYRIIQECVNNIIKHSGATEAQLIIKKEHDGVLITISDNGKGFDVNAVLSDKLKRGIGLMDINERAKLFNGKVEFKSAPGMGTTCKISIPLKQ